MRDYERYTDNQLEIALGIVNMALNEANLQGNPYSIETAIERKEDILAEMGLRCAKAYAEMQKRQKGRA